MNKDLTEIEYKQEIDKLINGFVERFIIKYFQPEDLSDIEYWWIADRPGEVIAINDYFFDFSTIRLSLELNIPEDILFSWYDMRVANKDYFMTLQKYFYDAKSK